MNTLALIVGITIGFILAYVLLVAVQGVSARGCFWTGGLSPVRLSVKLAIGYG